MQPSSGRMSTLGKEQASQLAGITYLPNLPTFTATPRHTPGTAIYPRYLLLLCMGIHYLDIHTETTYPFLPSLHPTQATDGADWKAGPRPIYYLPPRQTDIMRPSPSPERERPATNLRLVSLPCVSLGSPESIQMRRAETHTEAANRGY